jgi:ELWxxDGT repeat protein
MTGNGDPFGFTPIGDGRAIFNATSSTTGEELWITDGTTAGTRLKDIAPGSARSFPADFTPLNDGRVVFTAYGAGAYSDRELHVTDGTTAGTRMVKDIWPNGGSSTPSALTAFGTGKVLFQAEDPEHGNELWVSDGTAGGTHLVKDIWPGPLEWDFDRLTTSGSGNPSSFVALDDRAVFQASDGNGHTQLWLTDGTEDGTALLLAFGGPLPI